MAGVDTIKGLGPAMAESCARAGIHSAEALRELGADAAYELCCKAGTAPHFIGYYALHMALQGRPWNDCKGAEKTALREAFDAMKARLRDDGSSLPAELSRALDRMGIR